MADQTTKEKLLRKAKGLSESKLRAFDIGNMSLGTKSLSKRELEEMKRRKDEEATAAVYQEFVASFEDAGKLNKSWVKGGVVNPDKKSDEKSGGSRLYKPTSKLAQLASTFSSTKEIKREEERREEKFKSQAFGKKKKDEKKKSNLELFKEELKSIQEQREERHAIKKARGDTVAVENPEIMTSALRSSSVYDIDSSGSFPRGMGEPGDENTTNIYVGNINPKMTEKELCEIFGKYGPLASVKIMWPRTEEERSRGRNCGFVAFMNRKDGERAMNALKGKEINAFEMKLGWGKAVPIPPHPIYIPPALAELTQPPPPSGLPFNAQIKRRKDRDYTSGQLHVLPENPDELDQTLANAVVKVVIPTERQLLALIHRMVEFVVREGPMFEAMIMNRELNNPFFRFLFDNKSPAHTYYRWKLYSILHGDTATKWRTEEFRMFKGGSIWRPPPINPFTQGMPEDLVNREANSEFELILRKGKLTNSQRDRLEDVLRELTPERMKIAEAMVWCLDHAEAAEEIVECIAESLSILQTPLPKKIARLFLVSDILFNSSAKVPNASFFRKFFQSKLKEIFKDINESYEKIEGRLKAEQFKQKVMNCFRAWEDWAVYPNDFLITLQNIFLGLVMPTKDESPERKIEKPLDLDGAPLEDVDGFPLAVLPKPVPDLDGDEIKEDVDGLPLMEADIDGDPFPAKAPTPPPTAAQPAFIRSKWEEVDETELQAQAMTTSKWEMLEPEEEANTHETGEDIDGMPLDDTNRPSNVQSDESDNESEPDSVSMSRSSMQDNVYNLKYSQLSEERRQKLREIEVKVVKYQDELEAGKRSRKSGMSLQDQVEHYRRKLHNKLLNMQDSPQAERDSSGSKKRYRSRSSSPSRQAKSSERSDTPKRKKKDKDRSPKRSSRRSRSGSRSRSPGRISRSPGRERKKHKSRKHRD
ncbi:U2 snRNP-associated SURP motif-containing protein [Biomphalaria glabrata]|uniref:U2 snRNP-associated SURP motif-containing protein-like n=1 Tax=Biomphalaria glabrata TaxID=6526 RepID=A0A9W2Z086_BIOGL|nr:U2 snRNP-associated SURP motif-containing protein-like [Biomphalaria glabrata]KAI8751458.1 U2 snRNP-associated SURP motif-containing protein-like [Biomphalaria glabrata]KAI8770541.1 U2 snRNP-associated SURP motif-containing protein [Biomphalaria glabrata]